MPSFLNAMTRQIPSSSIHAATQKAEAYRREGKKVVIFSIGRPDFDTPAHIKEAAKAALDKGYVHYTPNMGILPLREAVAEHIKRQTGVSYDPKTEVMITCGGQQAILLTMKAVLEPGDEVLLPSPGYGLYYNCAAIADARVRAYALKAPDFGWGGAEAGERTKMLFINSPHNPTGAVLSKEELGQIADFAKANNLLVVSDEAYDRLLYDGLEHRSIASEPGMRDRTVILGSFSKTYSMTGWRIGYLAGPAEVIRRHGPVAAELRALRQQLRPVGRRGSHDRARRIALRKCASSSTSGARPGWKPCPPYPTCPSRLPRLRSTST